MDHLINQIRISRIAAGDLHAWRQLPDTWINCITKLHLSVSCCAVWGAGGYFCNTFPRRHDVLYFESTDRNDPGIIALIATIVLYASVLGYAIHQYGSIDGFLKAYSDMQGMDYNELMKQFMQNKKIVASA